MALKANYTVHHNKGHNLLIIEDLNIGNMSVTNDIEDVVLQVFKTQGGLSQYKAILALNSEGLYDVLDINVEDGIFNTWKKCDLRTIDDCLRFI